MQRHKNILSFSIFLFPFFFFLPSAASATTIAPSLIESDTVWTAAESPYLMAGIVRVEEGAALTIESGTVVKATRFGALEVAGSLRVTGTTGTPVIFTSYNDDTVGGDTNDDGAVSLPAGGDWLWLKFLPASYGSVEHAEFRYGGYEWQTGTQDGQIIADGASPELRNVSVHDGHVFGRCVRLTNSGAQILNSDFSGGYECVRIEGGAPVLRGNSIHGAGYSGIAVTADSLSGQLILRDNRIYENANYGLVSSNAEVVDARLNWWGSDAGPCVNEAEARVAPAVAPQPRVCNETESEQPILGNILYDPWIGKTREPVVLIPGIMGSWQKRGTWMIDPILHTYDNLLESFRAQGYVDGQTLFTFPYDWKISNVLTAHYLAEKLAEVRAACSCYKVDLIAHSMGGLIARQYISSSEYADDVDQVIFLGTPHRGAPRDYLTWEAGEIEPNLFGLLQKKIFELQGSHLGYTNLFNYIHNYPISTVRELLSVYNYLRNASDNTVRPYSHCESAAADVAISPCLYPTNPFLEVLNSEEKLANLQNTHVRFTNIVGDTLTNETINMLRVLPPTSEGGGEVMDQSPPLESRGGGEELWQHGQPENYSQASGDHGLELGSGDNTVPLASATHFNVEGAEELTLNSDHSALPTTAQEEILEKLTGNLPSSSVTTWRIPNTFLLVRVFSPVDVQITDPQGRRIGVVIASEARQSPPSSGEGGGEVRDRHCESAAADVAISSCELSEIPGAFYSGADTENEFIFIPDPQDGEYQIQTQGTATGTYRIATSLVSHCESATADVAISSCAVESTYTGTTSINQLENLNLELNLASSTIQIQPADTTPPQITITSPASRDYTRGESLTVNITITDDSVLTSHEIRLDDIIQTGCTEYSLSEVEGQINESSSPEASAPLAQSLSRSCFVDSFFLSLGTHQISIAAIDTAGNTASSSVQFRLVATLESAISDTNRAYQLGWLNLYDRNFISGQLREIVKHRARIDINNSRQFGNNVPSRLIQYRNIFLRNLVRTLRVNLTGRYRISPPARSLITEDLTWIMNNL